MKENQPKTFQYIKLEHEKNRFFCVQQNLGMVIWILFCKKSILRPIIRTDLKRFSLKVGRDWLRRLYSFFMNNAAILMQFAIYQKRIPETHVVLELPYFGHLCLPVHKGCKIFDLRRKVVIKVFDRNVHPSVISSEIDLLQHISPIDFAPSIRKWNIEERWYEENYLAGSLDSSYNPMDSDTLLKKFRDDVVHKLNTLILFQKPKVSNAVSHLTFLTKILNFSRLLKQESSVSEFRRVDTFVNSLINQLRMEEECPILLVFTHGDFVPANMLNTSHGLKIIDWEGAGFRSALFDFYSYFFYRSANRGIEVEILISEIQAALHLFIGELAKKSQNVSENVKCMERVYRWTFYIEMLCRLIERDISDKNLNVLKSISQYLDAFNRYEELLAFSPSLNFRDNQ